MPKGEGLTAPFLKRIAPLKDRVDAHEFPFRTLRFLRGGDFTLAFRRPITFFVGENGSAPTGARSTSWTNPRRRCRRSASSPFSPSSASGNGRATCRR